MPRTDRGNLAAVAAAAAVLGLATWLALEARREPPPEIGGYVLAEPRTLPSVELVDEHGQQFRTADFAGHWSLLYFGYTHCPDVCPLALLEFASLKKELATRALADPIEYYLVSVDPRRDTPERLRAYVTYFDPSFHGITGPEDALALLARATDTVFLVPEGQQDGDNYLVSHSSNAVLLNPDGAVHAVFAPPRTPAQLATELAAVVRHYARP